MQDDIFSETGTAVPDTEDKPAAEYRPLPTAEDLSGRPKETEYDSDHDGIKKAAKELSEVRAQAEAEPLDRSYRWDGGQGDPVEDHYTLDARRAADDLSRVREAEVARQLPPLEEVAQVIDNVRNQFAADPVQAQQPVAEAPTEQQATEAQPATDQPTIPDGVDPEIAQALNNPKVRAALEAEVAQVEQQRQAFAVAARQAAQLSAASVLSNFPELANVPTAHMQTAIDVIAQKDPQRAQAINGALQRTQQLYNVSLQAQQQQQQIEAARFEHYGRQEDSKFAAAIANESTETKRSVLEHGARILQEHYGVSAQELAQAVQTTPALRSSAMQRALFDLIKVKVAQENIANKVHREVPPVQRPGVSVNRNADNDEVDAKLRAFRSAPSPRSAADLLIARRK